MKGQSWRPTEPIWKRHRKIEGLLSKKEVEKEKERIAELDPKRHQGRKRSKPNPAPGCSCASRAQTDGVQGWGGSLDTASSFCSRKTRGPCPHTLTAFLAP